MSQDGDSVKDPAAQAAAWVARLHGEDATGDDWLALEDWLNAAPANLSAYDKAERLWALVGDRAGEISSRIAADDMAASVIDLTARRELKGWRRWAPGLATAAAAAAVVAVVVAPNLTPPIQTFQTAPGEIRRVALADGTVIRLNGGSKISVRLGRKTREVRMEMAEASFDVAKDANRPFLIDTGGDEVRVVGTEFNVDQSREALTVTVRRGVVQVRPQTGGQPAIKLTPGLELTAAAGAPYQVRTTTADNAFAWQGDRLIYADAPLSKIAADLSRRFKIVIVADPAVARLKFSGVLILDDPDAVVRRLEGFLPVRAHRNASTIRLSSR